ncbi:MAG: LPS export ABC transporter periplasmic protein LptC [Gammaproteobacteria bacterium]|nr:LPS export ABC transporter periplasmic protein LptC [Gammaproteobacteria bacterium]
MTKKILFGAVITGILGVILYLVFPKKFEESTTTDLADVPDIYLKDVKIQAFDETGQLVYELAAVEIEQFTAQHKMLFKNLKILVERENGDRWHMNADLGSVQPESDELSQILEPIELLGSVNVYSGDVNDPEYLFSGMNVVFDPRTDTIHSDEDVHIKAGVSTYDADSFRFDLATKRLQLSSEPGSQVEIKHESIEPE